MSIGVFVAPEDYPQIRAAIDLSLSGDNIPDEMIEMDIHLPVAEEEVQRQDLTWATDMLDSTKFSHMKRAAIFYCAALLVMALPQMEMEYFGEYRYHRTLIDWKTLSGNLRSRGDAEMGLVNQGGSLTTTRPTAFAVAPGGREAPRFRGFLNGF